MKKIKVLTSFYYNDYAYQAGQIYDLDDDIADKLEIEKKLIIISTLTDKEIEKAIEEGVSIDGIDLSDYYTKTETNELLKDVDVTIESENLFNPETVTFGYYVRWSEGVLINNSNFAVSDYIEIEPKTNYTINYFHQVAFYDENKVYIGGVDGYELVNKTITSLASTKYIRVSLFIKQLGVYKLQKGSSITNYESYGKKITGDFSEVLLKSNIIYKPISYAFEKLAKSIITNENVVIKLIGDSITHGVGGTGFEQNGDVIFDVYKVNNDGHCWANSFKSYMESKFNCTVLNYGTTGRNSTALLNNIHTLVKDTDDIIICMIGTNDRDDGSKGILYQNLLDIYHNITVRGKKVIFMSSIPAKISNESNKVFHMEDVDVVISCVASTLNCEYVSLYKLFIEYCKTRNVDMDTLMTDEVHPNDEGYDVMFYLVCNALGFGVERESIK